MRVSNIILNLLSLALIGAGMALIVSLFFGPTPSSNTASTDSSNFNIPVLEESTRQEPAEPSGRARSANIPEDKTLTVTIPEMARVSRAEVPDAAGDDEEALRENAAIHLQGTGFPWERGANVYIAGHRLGYPGTQSFLAFYDLDRLMDGDEIIVTDANGVEYRYRVFNELVVDPTNLSVTESVPGKDVLTLQTCTLPDYSQRLIVQAEKVA